VGNDVKKLPIEKEQRRSSSYRAVWQWHFYAGLVIAPFLLLMAITGSLYLFDREFEGWWDSDFARIKAENKRQPLAAQEAVVQAIDPQATVKRVVLPFTADDTAKWLLQGADGRKHEVHVDPYTLKITGIRNPDDAIMSFIRRIHGTLLGGEIGSHVVELVACWTMVMLVTGLWMWWPKHWRSKGVFVPRVGVGGRRMWRDFHAVPSALISFCVLVLILTGLPWSAFWGVQLAKSGEILPFVAPTPNFAAHAPAAHADHQVKTAKPMLPAHDYMDHSQHMMPATDPAAAKIPWVIQNSPLPKGGAQVIGIAKVEPHLAMLDRAKFGEGVRIFYPDGPGGTFMINYVPDQAEGQRTIHVDPANGLVLDDIGWQQYSPGGRLIEWGTMLHMGRQYGLVNQLANLAICLTLIGAIISALVHYWKRRPRGEFGAPTVREGAGLPRGLKATLIATAIAFPLVGASMLPILALVGFNRWRKSHAA
jgi:uncharacterized iron-regulated membrane protein